MDTELVVAIIGLTGAIACAIITYIFTIREQIKEQQRVYYISYIESVMSLRRDYRNIEVKKAYEKARVDLLMLGSCEFIFKMNEYERQLIGAHDELTPIDKVERQVILQARKDLKLSNKGFPDDLYLFTLR